MRKWMDGWIDGWMDEFLRRNRSGIFGLIE
jgi:hypothetical protein